MKEMILVCSGTTDVSNQEKIVGWKDVKLSDKGRKDALQAGRLLKEAGYSFDLAYTSVLTRGIQTLWGVMEGLDLYWLKVNKNWRLNGRYYGKLEGLSYQEIIDQYGQEKFDRWMQDYLAFVPMVDYDDPTHPSHDPRYRDLIAEELPVGENLQETASRVYPHWDHKIRPMVAINRRVLVVAHHSSIRALMAMAEGLSIDDLVDRPITRARPLVYRFDDHMNFVECEQL